MSTHHIVQQGDHLSGIAKQYGFSDYRTIWLHPQNAALRAERHNPNVIFPGDRVFIPDKDEKQELRETDQRHRFQVEKPKLQLHLVLEDQYERPLAKTKCALQVDGETRQLTTDRRGLIKQDITAEAQIGHVIVSSVETPINEVPIPIKIGHLDPEKTVSGQKARLNNLGYFAGPEEDRTEEENQAQFVSAIEEFQCDEGLTVDGKCGPRTQAKLKEVHGC
jgi:hypothetical protein